MAKKKKNSKVLYVIIIGLLLFLVFKDKISFGGDSDKCNGRDADPDRSGYCLVSSSDHDGLIVITGNTKNSPEPNLDFSKGSKLEDILSGVFYSDGQISIVSAAGNNEEYPISTTIRPKSNLNASSNNLKKLEKQINDSIKESPKEPGANYFGAILKAQNIIKAKGYKRPIIVIVGSGYSDRGVLDFAHDDILGRYAQNERIEDLVSGNKSVVADSMVGVTIKWYNAGVTSEPQKSIDEHNRALTIQLYEKLFSYLGADSEILGDSGLENYSSVESDYSVGQVYVQALQKGDNFSVNEDVGRFKTDSNELINRDEVKDKLRSFASQFNNNGPLRLKLTGYIAICSPGSNLGELRAEAIKQILVELGVSSNKIDVYGQPGAPSSNPNEDYTCNSDLPETERRTVIIEVVGD